MFNIEYLKVMTKDNISIFCQRKIDSIVTKKDKEQLARKERYKKRFIKYIYSIN